jgi:hypothetical protein
MSFISIDDAVARVGRAKFGERWIGWLTEDEDWLYRRYVEGTAAREASSIIPGMITFMSTEGGIRRWDWPDALRKEIELARNQHDRMEDQYAQVDEWLEEHDFDPNAERLPAEAFFAALEREFGKIIDGAELPRVPDDTGSDALESLPKPRKGGRPGDLGDRYRAEFRLRREAKIPLCASKTAEAAAIVAALQERGELPKNPAPSVRTAENAITEMYNKAKAGLNAA